MVDPLPDAVPSLPDLEGQHDHTVDDKGRVSIPADFRHALSLAEGTELVVTRHLKERCLRVYPLVAWETFKAQAERDRSPVGNIIRRVVKGSARRAKVDRLGRISLPNALRSFARLDGKCFVMGMNTCMEIWNVELWNEVHGPEAYNDVDVSIYDM